MRTPADPAKVRTLLRELGRRARGPGRAYLIGGACALLEGWRAATVDVDLKLDPEPLGAFEAIARLKNELDLNVELVSPGQEALKRIEPDLIRYPSLDPDAFADRVRKFLESDV